jgi:hypothetical protein
MKPNILTLLACSSSLIAGISSPSYGLTPPNLNNPTPSNFSDSTKYFNSLEESPQENKQSVEMKLQQLSQQNFGCTCANCLAATKQMVKEGNLSL